jgi:AAA family ATP:ADP antiporter
LRRETLSGGREAAGNEAASPQTDLGGRELSSAQRTAWAGFVVLGLMVAGHGALETARDTLFLSELSPSKLPFLYLAVAAVTVLLTRNPLHPPQIGSQRRVLVTSLALAAGVTVGFWSLISRFGDVALYALYLWSALFVSLVVVRFWILVGEHFTVTEARRSYGFIAAGSLAGAIAGAALSRALVALAYPRALLILSAGLFALAGVAAALLLPSHAPADPGARPVPGASPSGQPLRASLHQPYFRRLGLLAVVATVVGTCVDFLFKSTVVANVPQAHLGAAFANAALLQSGLALLAQLLLTGWLLRAVGVTRTLLVLPAAIALGIAGFAVSGGLLAAFALKALDASLRQSLHRTGTELLYLPVEDALRREVKPLLDVFGSRLGQALAALALLGSEIAGASPGTLALLLLALLVAWVLLVRLVHDGYLDLFRETLRRGRVRLSAAMPSLDLNALEALLAALNSRDDTTVLSALDLLAASGRARVVPALILFHPSREVVLRAFELFRVDPRRDDLPVMERLLVHSDAEVRAAALRAVAAASPADEALAAGLHDASPFVRATALVGLAFRSSPDASHAAARLLPVAQENGDAAAALARAIRAQPSPLFTEVLRALARHPSPEVQREAALTLQEQRDPLALPALVAMLASPRSRGVARDALVAHGAAAVTALAGALADRGQPLEVRRAACGVLARFPPEPALAQLLISRLDEAEDGLVRFRALRALGVMRARAPRMPLDAIALTRFLSSTVTQALRYRHWRQELAAEGARTQPSPSPGRSLLAAMLLEKERFSIERTFRALALLQEGDDVWRIYLGFQDLDPKVRASSRELLESLVRPPLRGALLVLVDPGGAQGLSEQTSYYYAARSFIGAGLLEELLEARSAALRALAAYHAGELGLQHWRPRLRALYETATPELREVLERALRVLDALQPPAPMPRRIADAS